MTQCQVILPLQPFADQFKTFTCCCCVCLPLVCQCQTHYQSLPSSHQVQSILRITESNVLFQTTCTSRPRCSQYILSPLRSRSSLCWLGLTLAHLYSAGGACRSAGSSALVSTFTVIKGCNLSSRLAVFFWPGPCKRLHTSIACEWKRLQRAAKQTGKTKSLHFSKGRAVMSSGIGPDISTFDMLLNKDCVSILCVNGGNLCWNGYLYL